MCSITQGAFGVFWDIFVISIGVEGALTEIVASIDNLSEVTRGEWEISHR